MQPSGYSGKSLTSKLGLKSGFRIKLINQPDYYFLLFPDMPPDIDEIPDSSVKKDFIHYFTKDASQLHRDLPLLRPELKENGMIWISWPKQSAKVETDLNGNIVRAAGLKNGLVDIKVCAVDEVWSGLKFVIPLKGRK